MPSLKEVKNRITSVMSTQQITKAMKMVAAAKLRKSQERIIQMRPFALKLNSILKNLSAAQLNADGDNWYSHVREEKKILIVAVSSDRGLCGSFNSSVFKGVNRLIDEKYADQFRKGNVTVLAIGRKSADYFGKRKCSLVSDYTGIFGNLAFDNVARAAEYIMQGFQEGKYDKVELVYNEFKNVATQVLRTEQFLPILPPAKDNTASQVDYIYQPSQEEIITGLIPKSLKVQLYKAVLDSNAAENGARMTAMDKATENAGELLKQLKLTYNRTRQAAITKEILEIVGGAEALKSA
ncbi:ATP synthase F1 subunit gamma [Fulvivirgaceae bacterium PWU4]|uniref:ATP synthase gamma chain n=1 Tax=Chryseosolibacter histidini TaxID=2782349 RepID=A0AAP2DRB7_9BACT|nr:ATP synthase F1 subunit gamma [Chryseosolibacter histidini]MBT1699812.1 ATP synthase F1 subunit gamma [Chryseosolibacter histidini]